MSSPNQGRLRLIAGGAARATGVNEDAILGLTAELVRFPTQGGVDIQQPALAHLADWLEQRGLAVRMLEAANRRPKNSALGLVASVGPQSGPVYCLTACLDTALFGSSEAWEGHKPTAPRMTTDGWLVGRGAADSKVGVAIFSALMAGLKAREHELAGRVVLLVDSDEHTGRFGAVKALVREQPRMQGVYIGYPGDQSIKIGARGFYRAKVTAYGVASHTGASRPSSQNAVDKAARLIQRLGEQPLPEHEEDAEFGLGPQRTTTAIHGGRGYSSVPDRCWIRVDYRLTPAFQASDARRHLRAIVDRLDADVPSQRSCRIDSEQSWPAYKLSPRSPVARALADAASRVLGRPVPLQVSGPSNVGNFLSSRGIDATCGFGVNHRNIHAANEAIEIRSIMPTYRAYRDAIAQLTG